MGMNILVYIIILKINSSNILWKYSKVGNLFWWSNYECELDECAGHLNKNKTKQNTKTQKKFMKPVGTRQINKTITNRKLL